MVYWRSQLNVALTVESVIGTEERVQAEMNLDRNYIRKKCRDYSGSN